MIVAQIKIYCSIPIPTIILLIFLNNCQTLINHKILDKMQLFLLILLNEIFALSGKILTIFFHFSHLNFHKNCFVFCFLFVISIYTF